MKMQSKKQTKQGISLIVLVITIIVMIILAAAIILSLTSNGLIDRANEAVEKADDAQVQTIASTLWAEAYLKYRDGEITKDEIKSEVIKGLKANKIDTTKYEITATENGIVVNKFNTLPGSNIFFGVPYTNKELNQSLVLYTDGHAEVYYNKVLFQKVPENYFDIRAQEIYTNETLTAIVSNDGKNVVYMGSKYDLDTTWCPHGVTVTKGEESIGKMYCHICDAFIGSAHKQIIPEGGKYYVGVTSNQTGIYTGATAIYEAGDVFPTLSDNDVYVYGDYEYRYNKQYYATSWLEVNTISDETALFKDTWGARVVDTSKESYGEIIANINGKGITCLATTFASCGALVSTENIMIPQTVKCFAMTFSECSSLSNVTIPNGIFSLELGAFSNCSSLNSITIPDTVVNITNNVFHSCTNLKNVILGNSVMSLSAGVFKYCANLESITIPNSLTRIGAYAFDMCEKLTTINYTGTKEEWQQIDIEDGNEALTNATINYNYRGE